MASLPVLCLPSTGLWSERILPPVSAHQKAAVKDPSHQLLFFAGILCPPGNQGYRCLSLHQAHGPGSGHRGRTPAPQAPAAPLPGTATLVISSAPGVSEAGPSVRGPSPLLFRPHRCTLLSALSPPGRRAPGGRIQGHLPAGNISRRLFSAYSRRAADRPNPLGDPGGKPGRVTREHGAGLAAPQSQGTPPLTASLAAGKSLHLGPSRPVCCRGGKHQRLRGSPALDPRLNGREED
ncbi:hypothetical protein NDU88_008869 [Pleurodeles waltl]|uniref:Uncharacterized protein n=1 Tax=Pleurodeles waltl TaxID=8319 RepID=A0AAV7PVM0_PLEWA|nr:hypothetical protein NDU88_008869 [Pleurodeles waltl]